MKQDKKKQWLSIGLLTLGAAALAVFAAATLDAGDVRASLAALLPGWTAAIVGCMLLYYLCGRAQASAHHARVRLRAAAR